MTYKQSVSLYSCLCVSSTYYWQELIALFACHLKVELLPESVVIDWLSFIPTRAPGSINNNRRLNVVSHQ